MNWPIGIPILRTTANLAAVAMALCFAISEVPATDDLRVTPSMSSGSLDLRANPPRTLPMTPRAATNDLHTTPPCREGCSTCALLFVYRSQNYD